MNTIKILLASLTIVTLTACTMPEPAAVSVLCDEPGARCTSNPILAAFETGSTVPGTSVTLTRLVESGLPITTSICVPATYTDGGIRGPARLRQAARDLLSGDLTDDVTTFACDLPEGTGRPDVVVGPLATELGPTDGLPTAYAVICDRSTSSERGTCHPADTAAWLLRTYLGDGAPPASRWLVVDSRNAYGTTATLLDVELSAGTLAGRITEARRIASAHAAPAPLAVEGESALVDAIAYGARLAAQGAQEQLRLRIASDGREYSRDINLDAHPERVRDLDALRTYASEALAELSLEGAEIEWCGLSAEDLTPSGHRALEAAWRDVLVAAGATSISFTDSCGGGHVR